MGRRKDISEQVLGNEEHKVLNHHVTSQLVLEWHS